jgi:hypothetical protein
LDEQARANGYSDYLDALEKLDKSGGLNDDLRLRQQQADAISGAAGSAKDLSEFYSGGPTPQVKAAAAGVGVIGCITKKGEILSRLGKSRESAARLGRKASEAEAHIGIHGVSTTAGPPSAPASQAAREAVESKFRVHDTPTRNDPLHRTVELPKPVTPEVADDFNKVFGRE